MEFATQIKEMDRDELMRIRPDQTLSEYIGSLKRGAFRNGEKKNAPDDIFFPGQK
jgi:hypothetical protein